MAQQNNQSPSLPLWKRLNGERTSGEWATSGDIQIRHKTRSILIAQYHKHLEANMPYTEVKANAAFTALAVNHLASLAEALTNLLSSYKADFYNITGGELNNTEAVLQAKEALNKIS